MTVHTSSKILVTSLLSRIESFGEQVLTEAYPLLRTDTVMEENDGFVLIDRARSVKTLMCV